MTHRAAVPRLQINARLVKEKDRARARELRRLLLYGAAIAVPLLAYVWQRVDFLRVSYQVEALKKDRQQMQERNKQLTVERSFLLSPDRIERVARHEIGLVDLSPSDVRRVAVIDGRIDAVGPHGVATTGAAPRSAAAAAERTPAAPRRRPARPRVRPTPVPRPAPDGAETAAVEAGVGLLPVPAPPAVPPSEPEQEP